MEKIYSKGEFLFWRHINFETGNWKIIFKKGLKNKKKYKMEIEELAKELDLEVEFKNE